MITILNRLCMDGNQSKNLYHICNQNMINIESIVHGWEPIKEFISYLQSKYDQYCIFFYNQYTPHVIGILFRPTILSSAPSTVSAMNCNYKRPYYNNTATTTNSNNNQLLAVYSINDIIREIQCIGEDIIQDVKIMIDLPECKKQKISNDENDDDSTCSASSSSASDDSDE